MSNLKFKNLWKINLIQEAVAMTIAAVEFRQDAANQVGRRIGSAFLILQKSPDYSRKEHGSRKQLHFHTSPS